MDNGLIFPYPLIRANAESSDTNTRKTLVKAFGSGLGGGVGLDW